MHVQLFAGLREKLGQEFIEIPQPLPKCIAELKVQIAAQYPAVQELLSRCQWAINYEFVCDDTVLTEADEIAVIPPVSGG